MSSFDRYVRRVFFGTLLLILLLAGIFFFVKRMPWARGVVLGGAASLVSLLIMAGDVRRQGAATGDQTVRSAYGRYALRMTIVAGALIYSALNENIALWATIPAVFAAHFAMTCGELLASREQGTS